MSDARRPPPSYDLVVLATSAGGLAALTTVLGALPPEFPAAVLVMQHLGRYGSALVDILALRSEMPVAWVTEGARLTPGQVLVCPPQRMVDIRPDRSCAVREGMHRAPDMPIDALFASVAASVGAQALAVVLTGLGRDGADGVGALNRAGATVLAQTEGSSEYPAMPRAAAASGGVDRVLTLDEIGPTLVRLVAGDVLPTSAAELAARRALFRGHGAAVVGPLLTTVDWAATSIGAVAAWPPTLCAAVRITLASHVPMLVHWGGELVALANDAALAVGGAARPAALGRPRSTAADESPTADLLCGVWRTGEARYVERARIARDRGTEARLSCSPILDPDATYGVGGVLTVMSLVRERRAPL